MSGPVLLDHDLQQDDFIALIERLTKARITFGADLDAEPLDERAVLTFDDGTEDHLALARTLAAQEIRAVFFVSAGAIGTPGHLGRSAIRELVAAGHRIGSHGWSHRRLDQVSTADLTREIHASREELEDVAGVPVTLFAPAGGIAIPALKELLRNAGYTASRSVRWGIYSRSSDRWHIPAIAVTRVTVRHGWVEAAVLRGRLPLAMVALRAISDSLGPDARSLLRGRVHGSAMAPSDSRPSRGTESSRR